MRLYVQYYVALRSLGEGSPLALMALYHLPLYLDLGYTLYYHLQG